MEFFKDRLLHTDWCHTVVNMPGVVLAVSSVRVCQPTLTCFLTFPNVFQVFACCAEDKLSLSFCKTTFVYLFPFRFSFFLWFSLFFGGEKKKKSINPTPLPSHNINTVHRSCLIHHKVFLIHQWSLLCNAHSPLSWAGYASTMARPKVMDVQLLRNKLQQQLFPAISSRWRPLSSGMNIFEEKSPSFIRIICHVCKTFKQVS